MDVRTTRKGGSHLIWDSECLSEASDEHFDPEWWRDREMVAGEASGRGTAYFLESPDGAWVLRHYRRGGMVSDVIKDRYAWFGISRSRAFREWYLLAEIARLGLPVPAPIAARVVRSGNAYRADLITECVKDASTLADRLRRQPMEAVSWQALGRTIARFHAAGVWHADLNANNILLDAHGAFTLIDFDHSRIRSPGRWRLRNLRRLRRSLDKLDAEHSEFHFAEADWGALHGGYLRAE